MATITSASTGNFSSPATWVGGIVPGPLDIVRANTGHNVTIDVNTTVANIQAITTGRFIMGEGVTLTANVIATNTGAGMSLLLSFREDAGTGRWYLMIYNGTTASISKDGIYLSISAKQTV